MQIPLAIGQFYRRLLEFAHRRRRMIALTALFLAFAIGCLLLNTVTFTDEGDNLAVGRFITEGSVLYRDLFSHHFPFAYFWVAAIVAVLGPSVLAVRLSLLFFGVLNYAVIMRTTHLYAIASLAAVIWETVAQFYFGQMALYTSLEGTALLVIFSLTLAILAGIVASRRSHFVIIGAYAAVALLSDPLMVLPVVVALGALALHRRYQKDLIIAAGVLMAAGSAFLAYLLVNRAAVAFYQDVYVFNRDIYSKYYDMDPRRLLDVVYAFGNGLFIFDPARWLPHNSLGALVQFEPLGRLVFGGLLFRVAVILATLVFVLRRKPVAGLFGYAFSASLFTRDAEAFRQTAFVESSIFLAALLILDYWPTSKWFSSRPKPLLARSGQATWILARALVAVILFWFAIRGAVVIYGQLSTNDYQVTFGALEHQAKEIRAITCGRDVELGYYPGQPIMYFLTGLHPVSKYVFLWPWVDEIADNDIQSSLAQHEAIVYFDPLMPRIWGIYVNKYLSHLQTYVREHEVPVGKYFLTPELSARCSP